MTEALAGGEIITADFEAEPEGALVARHGMGFRGVFAGGIHLHLARLQTSRGELTGMLSVRMADRVLFKGRFNCASLSARKTLVGYLKDRTGGYDGWPAILEKFCWHVLTIDEDGPERQTIGDQPKRERIPCLVEPILPLGEATILFGEGGSFKSTIAAMLAVSVQTGVSVFPGWTPMRGNVLVLDWESTQAVWNDRVVAIANGLGLPITPVIEYRHCAHRLCDIAEAMGGVISQFGIALVIVDSVGLAQGPSGEGGANDATLRLFGALRLMGVTSLLIDHVAKQSIENPKAKRTPYDSVYKVNLARSVFDLRKEANPEFPEASQVAMMHTKVNDQPALGTFGIRIVHGETTILMERCSITAPDLEEQAVTLAERIRRVLKRGPMTNKDLAEELNASPDVTRRTANRSGSGVIRLGDQRWALGAGQ